MPTAIDSIDHIARKKQRDVVFIAFGRQEGETLYDHHNDPKREQLLRWLDVHQIAWEKADLFASECGFRAYRGSIYVDVPYDEQNAQFQLLKGHLENESGEMLDPEITLYYVPLEEAMKNAHHDEPGFWDQWAENF